MPAFPALAAMCGWRIVPNPGDRAAEPEDGGGPATMDDAYISALAALGGTVVGGLTSFATTWLTQVSQARSARLAAERARRDDLYGKFLDEMAELYSHALSEDDLDYARLVPIMALKGRIALQSSGPVVACAERSVRHLVDLYMAPRLSTGQVRALMDEGREDPMKAFAGLCREEMRGLR